MSRNIFIIAGLLLASTISCNLAPEYNLNFAPPSDKSWPEDIYPAKIAGISPEISTKQYGGTEAKYGSNKTIYIARFTDQKEAISFFQQNVLSEFKTLSTNFSATVNGQFYAEAHDNTKKYFAWVNHRYLFVLKGNSAADFDTLVNNFNYISKKK